MICAPGTNILFIGQLYFKKQANRLIEKEIRFVVTRGGVWGKEELDEGSQEVQTSSYKITKH